MYSVSNNVAMAMWEKLLKHRGDLQYLTVVFLKKGWGGDLSVNGGRLSHRSCWVSISWRIADCVSVAAIDFLVGQHNSGSAGNVNHHRVGPIVKFHRLGEELCVVVQSAMTSILDFIRVQFDLIFSR